MQIKEKTISQGDEVEAKKKVEHAVLDKAEF